MGGRNNLGMSDEREELARPTTELIPLTAAQRGMWFAEHLHPDYSVTVAHYLDIRDGDRPLDRDLFCRSVLEAARSLESAFTRIAIVDDVPTQWVDPAGGFHVEQLDMREDDDPVAAARDWMDADHRRPMDLLTDQVAISALIRVADDRSFWYLRGHHIAFDGYSALNSLHEGVHRYNAALAGREHVAPPRASLADISADDERYAQSTRRQADADHWAQRVADLPEGPTLSRRAAAAPLSSANVMASTQVTAELQDQIDSTASTTNSSAATVLTAAFAIYLSRMTGVDDIVLSLPVTGRATAKIKRASGMVANMLPVRVDGVSSATGRALIAQVQLELTGALRHQRHRYEDIRVAAGMADATAASFGPIVNLVFFDRRIEIDGAQADYHILASGILDDLRINLYQASPGERLVVDLHGNPNLYERNELESHLQRFLTLVDRLLADLDAAVPDLPLLFDGEHDALIAQGRGPRRVTERTDDHLLAGFERQVVDAPDAVAIEAEDIRLTYRQFSDLRTSLAGRLHDDGVSPGDRVVVALDRGVAQVCAVYAVLTAGAVYVPVDPDDPLERLDAIDAVVAPTLRIDEAYLSHIGFDAVPPTAAVRPIPAARVDSRSPAYVIFTSGSTGTPKGVQVDHRAVVNRLDWMQHDHPIDADDVVLYKTPSTFDVSVWELFWPLRVGATMAIARPDGHRDPDYLQGLIVDASVSVVHFVPSMLDVYIEVALADGRPACLPERVRKVFTSGEALSAASAARLMRTSSAALVNLYGPTEAAVDVTAYRVAAESDPVPIGRPVADTTVVVLDTFLRPVPAGVAGELYLAGRQLATGYVGAPGLTAERFVANPFDASARMYRTGDLVRWNDAGELDYLGRTDLQVKIRGRRVELGEIESVLTEVAGVEAAAVLARTDLGVGPRLVAYVRGDAGLLDVDVIADRCRRRLPPHMVPFATVVLDEFPVTGSGKLDRRALPVPVLRSDIPHAEPSSEVEIVLAELIATLLAIDRVGMRDNIFALGADSLTAARLVSVARTEHRLAFGLADVFDSGSIGELASRAVVIDAEITPEHRAPRPALIPLTHAQTRLWFINRMDPQAPTYNMSGALRLGAEVDVDALVAAVRDVVERHAILRTIFPSVDGEPIAQVLDMSTVRDELDEQVRAGIASVSAGSAADTMSALVGTGFDLEHEIGFRCHLLPPDLCAAESAAVGSDGAQSRVVVLVVHHIAADGASLRPLIRDLLHAYGRRRDGLEPRFVPLEMDFAEVALRQRARLGGADDPTPVLVDGLDFWRLELRGAPGLLTLPTDRPRPQVADGRGAHIDTGFDADLSARIRGLAADLAVTPFAVLHSALAVVLSRLAGTDDVSIGSAVAGRDDPATGEMVGMFVNTVVLRSRLRPGQSVGDLVSSSHRSIAHAMAHAEIPFERVVDALAPQRSSGHAPLFQVALTMQSDPLAGLVRWPDAATFGDARVAAAKYDLTLTVTEPASPVESSAAGYQLEINYATALFDEQSAAAIGVYLRRVLDAMVSDPAGAVGRIGLVADDTPAVNRGSSTPTPQRTLTHLLAAGAAAADPDGYAVSGAVTVTWSMFEARTNQLARELISRGVGPGQIVAITMGRSHDSVMAVVAVAKTGAAFVTVDPRQPDARRAALIADSTARLGLTSAEVGATDTGDPSMSWLTIDDETFELGLAGHSGAPIVASERTRPVHLSDLAYLLFTSGSTGRPKAAAVTHAGLADLVDTQATVLRCDRFARVLHVASPSFDVSLFEMILSLCAGAELVISPSGVFAGPELEDLLADHDVTHAVMTPSALATIDPAAVPCLRVVASAGEQCPPEVVARWDGAGRDLFNFYGPTEATITATTAGPMRSGHEVTIGREIAGMTAFVLDDWLRPVPDGVIGELYLAGEALGRGYHERSELTAARFVANPFDGGATRMYRSGDRVSRGADGELTYHGRTDFQIKIRGVRIEPGEIDVVLSAFDGIDRALTLATVSPTGEMVLISYVTATAEHVLVPHHIVDHAERHLPAYLVPRTVVVIDEFPLTAVGKVDRAALPPVTLTASPESVAPRSQMESVVAGVFAQVLGHDQVGVYENFFALGGNSLSATKVSARIEKLLDRRLSVRMLLENPTVATLVGALTSSDARGSIAPPLTVRPRSEVVPVSGVQRSMWLVNRADPESSAYNVSLALRLTGELDVPALRAAVTDLVVRRETLRTTYPLVGGEPAQVIAPASALAAEFVVPLVDLAARRLIGSHDPVPAAITAITDRGFDIASAIPVRAAILRVGPTDHVLVFVVHHISADGASLMPLARDLVAGYAAHRVGRTPVRTDLTLQYADWALWQRDRLEAVGDDGVSQVERQLGYWSDRLAGAPDRIELPTDRPRPATPSFRGGTVDFVIPAQVVEALETVAREHNTTMFMVVHAAFAVLLSRLTGRDDVVVGTPYVGRDDETLEDMVGMFVNALALRTRVAPGEQFDQLLHRVRGEDLADMSNADVAFDQIVGRVLGAPTGAHNPLFQVMFAFQNMGFPTVELEGLQITPEPPHSSAAKVDLEFMLFPDNPANLDSIGAGADARDGGAMTGRVVFATDLYDAVTVERIVARYLQVLAAVAADPTRVVGDIDIDADRVIGTPVAQVDAVSTDLAELVAEATMVDPDAIAAEFGGVAVSFGDVDSMATALSMTMPDGDAYGALTMALTAVLPEMADGGVDALDQALDQLHLNACRLIGATTVPETVDRA